METFLYQNACRFMSKDYLAEVVCSRISLTFSVSLLKIHHTVFPEKWATFWGRLTRRMLNFQELNSKLPVREEHWSVQEGHTDRRRHKQKKHKKELGVGLCAVTATWNSYPAYKIKVTWKPVAFLRTEHSSQFDFCGLRVECPNTLNIFLSKFVLLEALVDLQRQVLFKYDLNIPSTLLAPLCTSREL